MRTEETSLLPEDEARRLPLDEIVMVIDAQMPVRAKRIQYFDDQLFKGRCQLNSLAPRKWPVLERQMLAAPFQASKASIR